MQKLPVSNRFGNIQPSILAHRILWNSEQHLRQMTRTSSHRIAPAGRSCSLVHRRCRRRAAEVTEYNDPHPLPEDALVVDAPSIGKHGGRFVFAETGNPRTFNAMMANETSSTDITDAQSLHVPGPLRQRQRRSSCRCWRSRGKWRLTALTWTFHLRRGAKFSDGHPITSEDVLFSAQVALDETLHPAVQDLLTARRQAVRVLRAGSAHGRREDAVRRSARC